MPNLTVNEKIQEFESRLTRAENSARRWRAGACISLLLFAVAMTSQDARDLITCGALRVQGKPGAEEVTIQGQRDFVFQAKSEDGWVGVSSGGWLESGISMTRREADATTMLVITTKGPTGGPAIIASERKEGEKDWRQLWVFDGPVKK